MVIPVTIRFPSKSIERGTLVIDENGSGLIGEHGESHSKNTNLHQLLFSINKEYLKKKKGIHLEEEDWILFQPESTVHYYSPSILHQNEMYPPSSGGWIGHFSESGIEAQFSVFPLVEEMKNVLLITDRETGELYGAFKINLFEKLILFMKKDWDVWSELYEAHNPKKRDDVIHQLLDRKAPSFSELAKLVEGVDIPKLKIGKTMRETMNQLVPESFPMNVREELMAFLALSIKLQIPDEDPLDFNSRYQSTPILGTLAYHHIQYYIEEKEPPNYVRIFFLADRGALFVNSQPRTEAIEQNPWDIAWMQLVNINPTRRGKILDLVNDLNEKQKIITSLPVTRMEATVSRENWIDRFTTILYALSLRGHVHNQKLGLHTLIYVGGAHRWPHKHLAWTARLGNPFDNPPYFQIMVVPSAAAERIKRIKPNIAEEDWSITNTNLNLFSRSTQKWRINSSRIIQAFSKERTLKQLEKEFNFRVDERIISINDEEARVLGFLTFGIILNSLELGEYQKHLGIDKTELLEILTRIRNEGLVQLRYSFYQLGLVSLFVEGHGAPKRIQSVTRAFLKYSPTATARIANDGKDCYILARIPEEDIYNLSRQISNAALDENISMRVMKVDAYAAYNHDLYTRLRNPDGTWDDDISGFLSQIRS